MANTYLYGVYGHLAESVAQSAVQAGTVLVYVGTAPVNLVREYAKLGLINRPVSIAGMIDAQRKQGYSSDWNSFTLCEAFDAHYNNPLGNIGPIYVINVLNPDIHRTSEPVQKEVFFQSGRAEIESDTIILDTLAVEDHAEGVDYSVDYNFARGVVAITSLDDENPLEGSVAISYHMVTPSEVTPVDIVGGVTAAGAVMGLGAVKLLHPEMNRVTNLIVAPGWSHHPEVYNALVVAGMDINGHWDAFELADIPLVDANGSLIDTRQKAINWKKANGYSSERTKVCWPRGIDSVGRIFHCSTLAAVELMRADHTHNSVPMETCGNKEIPVIRQYFGPDSSNQGFDQQEANELTQNGITTLVSWGGRWVLWGDHTAAYTYSADVDPRAIFDTNMRMLLYITNSFQQEWGTTINGPMTRQLSERILNREQEKLDRLVSRGALIGEPSIQFLESENSTTDLMNGNFRWDILATPTPPLKSATAYAAYTDAGFSIYFEEGEG